MVNRMMGFCVALTVMAVAGCGGDEAVGTTATTVPLSGKLLIDGQPRGAATIQFVPAGAEGGARTSYAVTEADGSFSATTYVTGDGIVPGKYKVTLGAEGDMSSTDPSKMMAAVQGTKVKESEITIPKDGLTGIEIKLQTDSGSSAPAGDGLLGQ